MKNFRHLSNVSTLVLNGDLCVGCGSCQLVCPHGVFEIVEGKASIVDQDGCMECGACAKNCAPGAIALTPGVGCAAYIIQTWLKGKGLGSCAPDCC